MSYLFISVLCSVSVSVFLKLATRFNVHLMLAITGGYLVAGALAYSFLPVSLSSVFSRSMLNAWWLLLGLGILLPSVFLIMAKSIQAAGLVKTDAAQRLSLVLALLAAFSLFGEALTPLKMLGIVLGLAAIVFIGKKKSDSLIKNQRAYLFLAGVFVGFAVIDIGFKQMSLLHLASFADTLFACFVLSFFVALMYCVKDLNKALKNKNNYLFALLLGSFNFANILFYIKAHRHFHESPALVFTSMNIGVIVLASLIGLLFFKERLSQVNYVGLLLAILAVLVLAAA